MSGTPPALPGSQLHDTRDAFDSVAADYDGPRGNNDQIQDMRSDMWRSLDATFPRSSRLIDLGCGTGLDAVRMAKRGHFVTAVDWSPLMVRRTVDRAEREQVSDRVRSIAMGAHELQRLDEAGQYDGAYSNLGPLNCVPDLVDVSRQCARLMKPGAALVFTVIGRYCPWEIAHYVRRRRWARATVRFARHVVPVRMNNHTIWTRYYGPREFYRAFEQNFTLEHHRGLCVFSPPPYLTWVREHHPVWHERLRRLDRRVSHWPFVRGMGDHFLIVMKRR
ncbi:MAG TPA: methyltransferase domain-containing protein [Steroidobacteraceae bacterium]|nr:methyltransferase domain-containing protein [Steroidobacteraceae bacterium]